MPGTPLSLCGWRAYSQRRLRGAELSFCVPDVPFYASHDQLVVSLELLTNPVRFGRVPLRCACSALLKTHIEIDRNNPYLLREARESLPLEGVDRFVETPASLRLAEQMQQVR